MQAPLIKKWITNTSIFLWLICSATVSFGQYLGTTRDLRFTESDQEWDDDSQQEPESIEENAKTLENDDDLAPTQESLRSSFRYGFALGLGSGMPWVEYYLEALYLWRPNIAFSYFNGIGDAEFSGSSKTLKYSIDSDQKTLGFAGRWYFWDIVPFYVDTSLSFVWWDGDITPQGPVTLGSTPSTAMIRGAFDAQGIVLASGIGLSYVWSNGITIDYKLIGVMRSFVTKLDMHDPGSLSRDSVKNNFNKAYEFGIFNLKVGYILK